MRSRKYTKETLEIAAQNSRSVLGVMRLLGIGDKRGGIHGVISKSLRDFGIDTSHFLGKGSNKGRVGEWKKSPDKILVLGERHGANQLRRALIESGVAFVCSECGTSDVWNGKRLVLQVDHIDGNTLNNLIENLRFLCPNCHSQTENFGYKNHKRKHGAQ